MALEWNVYVSDVNAKTITTDNVFDHPRFLEDCRKAARKFKERDAFLYEVRKCLMYYYWSKCELEVVIDHWPPVKGGHDYGIKVDVYEQIVLNWDRFCDYVWENRKELAKKT